LRERVAENPDHMLLPRQLSSVVTVSFSRENSGRLTGLTALEAIGKMHFFHIDTGIGL
jgi:hypothetical protein